MHIRGSFFQHYPPLLLGKHKSIAKPFEAFCVCLLLRIHNPHTRIGKASKHPQPANVHAKKPISWVNETARKIQDTNDGKEKISRGKAKERERRRRKKDDLKNRHCLRGRQIHTQRRMIFSLLKRRRRKWIMQKDRGNEKDMAFIKFKLSRQPHFPSS